MEKIVRVTNCPLCSSVRQEYKLYDWQGNRFVECLDCSLVFQNPRKIIEYEENYWKQSIDPDGKVRVLANERESKIKNLYKDDIKFVNKLKRGKILDAGCGFGFFLSALNKNWKKFGIELSEYCVNFVKEKYPDIKIISANLEDKIFEDNFFDIIYFFHIIEHVFNPNKVMYELSRILKPGGILIISTPNIRSLCAKWCNDPH